MGKRYEAIKKAASLAPKEIIKTRLEECRTCEFAKMGLCTKCGCVIRLKTKFAGSKCPIGVW